MEHVDLSLDSTPAKGKNVEPAVVINNTSRWDALLLRTRVTYLASCQLPWNFGGIGVCIIRMHVARQGLFKAPELTTCLSGDWLAASMIRSK